MWVIYILPLFYGKFTDCLIQGVPLFFKRWKINYKIFVTFLVSEAKKLGHYLILKQNYSRFRFQDIYPGWYQNVNSEVNSEAVTVISDLVYLGLLRDLLLFFCVTSQLAWSNGKYISNFMNPHSAISLW